MQTITILKTRLKGFQISDEHFEDIWATQVGGKIRLFKLLDILIRYAYLDSGELHTIVSILCRYHLNFYESEVPRDLEAIAKELDYTRERVRQIKDSLKERFTKKFSFIDHIEYIQEISIDTSRDFISIDTDQQSLLNANNGTDFTRKFIARIYGVIYREYFEVIGDEEKPEWKSSYLVAKANGLDYVKALNAFRIRLRPNPIRKEISVIPFAEIVGMTDGGQISSLKQLVIQEEGIESVGETGLVLPISKGLVVEDFLLKAFSDLGVERKGYHLDTIIGAMDELQRNAYKRETIRSRMGNDPRFISFGKKSTYVLAEWLDIPGIDIILGGYERLCQAILEAEPMPLDMETLFSKISEHRREPVRRSMVEIIGSNKAIFQIKGSCVGLVENKEHLEILAVTERIPVSFFSKELWRGLIASGEDVVSYLRETQKLSDIQIDYLIRYMKRVLKLEEIPLVEIGNEVGSDEINETEIEKLLNQLAELDRDEEYRENKIRLEHVLLKKLLFRSGPVMNCAICGDVFPVELLTVAHIKRRSKSSLEERMNSSIVMAACHFGCDALYERGYICVNQNGQVIVMPEKDVPVQLATRINELEGKNCVVFNDKNKKFFKDHYEFHIEKIRDRMEPPNN